MGEFPDKVILNGVKDLTKAPDVLATKRNLFFDCGSLGPLGMTKLCDDGNLNVKNVR